MTHYFYLQKKPINYNSCTLNFKSEYPFRSKKKKKMELFITTYSVQN